MSKGGGEQEWVDLCKYHGIYWRRYRDKQPCKVCGAIPPKSEKMPDYGISYVQTHIECKINNSTGRWNFASPDSGFTPTQRDFLNEYGGWVFLILGLGRAPDGKGAWLIPWITWNEYELTFRDWGMSSIRFETTGEPHHKNYRPGAPELLSDRLRLEWTTGIGWTIPNGHPFWLALHRELHNKLKEVQKWL